MPAKTFKKPSYQPTVNIPQDVHLAIWNPASSGNAPWVEGLGPFTQGRHLPVMRGKRSSWELPREFGGRRLVEDASAVVIAPWMDSEP
eukprot:1726968-Pyramimonas_sp.AAC.1